MLIPSLRLGRVRAFAQFTWSDFDRYLISVPNQIPHHFRHRAAFAFLSTERNLSKKPFFVCFAYFCRIPA